MDDAIAALAADRTSGATALVLRAIAILQRAAADRRALEAAARDLCRAQPSMGGMHTAAALAIAAADPVSALGGLEARVARAASAIARIARPLLTLGSGADGLRVVTCSRSAAVEATLAALGAAGPLRVACSESRPAREGLALAHQVSAPGVEIHVYTDAGIAHAVPGADAILVGADAVGVDGFVNKAGTSALCALGAALGVPVFVLAGREKILPAAVFSRLQLAEGSISDVELPPGPYVVRNPLFDRSVWGGTAHLVTDGSDLHPAQAVSASLWSAAMVESYLSAIR